MGERGGQTHEQVSRYVPCIAQYRRLRETPLSSGAHRRELGRPPEEKARQRKRTQVIVRGEGERGREGQGKNEGGKKRDGRKRGKEGQHGAKSEREGGGVQ
eukprot:6180880-Pleurochrysis_carterae.AAC.2